MTERVLFVDDDSNILAGYRRQLRKRFDLHTAASGAEGLETLKAKGPFAVVVSDMNMPEMDGLQFLKRVNERSGDTVRIMLTGNADQKTAVDAVNEGKIFRFCNKPCPPDTLAETITSGLQHYRLITAERQLLERTLAGSVKVLLDVLAMVDPKSFGATARLRDWMRRMVTELGLDQAWEYDLAAMLSPIGRLTLPQEIQEKMDRGETLSGPERDILARIPGTTRDLIANIPRLEKVSEYLYYQGKGFDGSGFPREEIERKQIPMGARMLKVIVDLKAACGSGDPDAEAFAKLEERATLYDPGILALARKCLLKDAAAGGGGGGPQKPIRLAQLQPGHRLAADIRTQDGQLLLAGGQEVTKMVVQKLTNLHDVRPIKEPIMVVPGSRPAEED